VSAWRRARSSGDNGCRKAQARSRRADEISAFGHADETRTDGSEQQDDEIRILTTPARTRACLFVDGGGDRARPRRSGPRCHDGSTLSEGSANRVPPSLARGGSTDSARSSAAATSGSTRRCSETERSGANPENDVGRLTVRKPREGDPRR
jgi:hypothetical protein